MVHHNDDGAPHRGDGSLRVLVERKHRALLAVRTCTGEEEGYGEEKRSGLRERGTREGGAGWLE